MRKARLKLITLFLLVVSASLGFFAVHYFREKEKSDQFIQKGQVKLHLIALSKSIWSLWREGVKSDLYTQVKKACPKENYENFGKCSFDLLNCASSQLKLKLPIKGDSHVVLEEIKKVSRFKNGELSPREGVSFQLRHRQGKLVMSLESSCSKIFLPQRIYGMGVDQNPDASKRFDNFKRNIFLDKRMFSGKGRTIDEMSHFCAERGMQLMTSHLLDAASFHPVNLRNNRPLNFIRPPLPWTRQFKSEFVYKAQKGEPLEFDKKYCHYLFSKECLEEKNESLPSWMGLSNPLGGPLEVVRNVLSPNKRLIPSSIHFPIKSSWHRLGLRASWDGREFDKRSFNFFKDWPEIQNYDDLSLGFRCFQEEWIK